MCPIMHYFVRNELFASYEMLSKDNKFSCHGTESKTIIILECVV